LKNPFLTGVFIWAGFDYRGEPSPYRWPCVNSHYGIIDTCGFPKDGYYYHKAMFVSDPVLHVMPHWTWPGREGREIKVWILTNVERVELYLNGRFMGERQVVYGSHAEFLVRYEPGELKAAGYRNGTKVAETVVATAGRPVAIRLEPDRAAVRADGRDAVPVRVSVLDGRGRSAPTACPLVRFSVSGPARIIGVGNGDPASHEPDKALQRRAFNGFCLAIVQSAGRRGRIVLTARSVGMRAARVSIRAR
jgi:beta-galactosidase